MLSPKGWARRSPQRHPPCAISTYLPQSPNAELAPAHRRAMLVHMTTIRRHIPTTLADLEAPAPTPPPTPNTAEHLPPSPLEREAERFPPSPLGGEGRVRGPSRTRAQRAAESQFPPPPPAGEVARAKPESEGGFTQTRAQLATTSTSPSPARRGRWSAKGRPEGVRNNPPQHQPPPPTSLTPAEHTALLEAFATSSMSLPQLAMLFNLTLADLAAWLAHPRTRADIEALRTLSAEREALTRALARPAAIAALEHTATQRDGASPETTRKAATTLLNLKPPTPAASTTQRAATVRERTRSALNPPTSPALPRTRPLHQSEPGRAAPARARQPPNPKRRPALTNPTTSRGRKPAGSTPSLTPHPDTSPATPQAAHRTPGTTHRPSHRS